MYYASLWHIDDANKSSQRFFCSRNKGLLQAATLHHARRESQKAGFVRGFWSVNDAAGRALSACTFDRPTGARWRRVPVGAVHFYDLSQAGLNRAALNAKKI